MGVWFPHQGFPRGSNGLKNYSRHTQAQILKYQRQNEKGKVGQNKKFP